MIDIQMRKVYYQRKRYARKEYSITFYGKWTIQDIMEWFSAAKPEYKINEITDER